MSAIPRTPPASVGTAWAINPVSSSVSCFTTSCIRPHDATMTDPVITEAAFMPVVGGDLAARFGPRDVIRQPTLPSGNVPDFIAEGAMCSWAVEVENEADNLHSAVGQALDYAEEYRQSDWPCLAAVYLPDPVEDFDDVRRARRLVDRLVTLDPRP